jgi:type I restriction enzyme S subunit
VLVTKTCGTCTGELLVFRPKNNLTNNYLYYYLLSKDFITTVDSSTYGSKMPRANWDFIGNLSMLIPSTGEQHAIARFLDRETERIDNLTVKKQRQIELLQEKRSALISHVVTKGLDPSVKMKDSGVEWLGEIPEHWKVDRAKVIFEEVDERSTTGEEELLSVSHITGVTPRSEKNVFMFMAESLEGYKKCKPGDLIINTMWAWMGAMGISSDSGIVSPSYNVYRFRSNAYDPQYFDNLLRTDKFISEVICYSQGVWTSRLRLYPEEFFQIRIPSPPLEEQRKIVGMIQKETGNYDVAKKKIEQSIQKLRKYRTAIISAAVTGKIDVRQEVA